MFFPGKGILLFSNLVLPNIHYTPAQVFISTWENQLVLCFCFSDHNYYCQVNVCFNYVLLSKHEVKVFMD